MQLGKIPSPESIIHSIAASPYVIRRRPSPYVFFHLTLAASFAMSLRCSFVSFSARALPPFSPPRRPTLPPLGLFFGLGSGFSACPVACCTMECASWFMSGWPCPQLLERLGITQRVPNTL